MILAQKIKDVALVHGKTISQIAEELGVAQSHVSRLINNERITLRDMEKLSKTIGCKVGDFFRDEITQNNSASDFSCPKCGCKLNILITEKDKGQE